MINGKIRMIFLLATTVLFLSSASAQNVNVTANDPRIDYVKNWVVQDGGGHRFVTIPGAYLTFAFQGSAIFYYGAKDPNGGVANVFVDSGNPQTIDASAGTALNDNVFVEVLFTQTGLDPSKVHTLNISYVGPGSLGGPYVTIYTLAFTPAGNSVPTISIPLPGSSSSTIPATGVQSSLAHSSSSSSDEVSTALHAAHRTNVILGAVLGTIAGLLLFSTILLLLLVIRNRREQQTLYGEASPFYASGAARSGCGLGSKTSRIPGPLAAEIPSSVEVGPRPIERLPLPPSPTSGILPPQTVTLSPPVYTV